MKAVKNKVKVPQNYILPGEPMKLEEFEALIQKAEKTSFTNWEEGKKEFEEWKKAERK